MFESDLKTISRSSLKEVLDVLGRWGNVVGLHLIV